MKMGVNLSDYVNYVLTKSMMGQMETDVESTPQYKKLKEAHETLEATHEQDQERSVAMSKRIASLQSQLLATQTELSKYETQVAPFKGNVGKPITIRGQVYHAAHPSELFGIILTTFEKK